METYCFGEAIKGWRMFTRLIDRYCNCGKIDTSVELKNIAIWNVNSLRLCKIKLLYPEYQPILSMYDSMTRRTPVQRLWCISRELFPLFQKSDQMNMVCKVIDWRVSFLSLHNSNNNSSVHPFFSWVMPTTKKIFKKKPRLLQCESEQFLWQLPVLTFFGCLWATS